MTVKTNSQRMAQAAYERVAQRSLTKEFASFAREFPALVHSCGLAQAVAFALAKGGQQKEYLQELAAVLVAVGHPEDLPRVARTAPVAAYLRLSRDALAAANWLKRYAEAAS